jgi:hypothetical protein
MRLKNILTLGGTCILIIMLVLCTIAAANSLAAFVIAYPATMQLDIWRDKRHQMDHDQWDTIRSRINHALQYTPDNPELLSGLGLAHEAEYIFYPATEPAASMARMEARTYYQRAIHLRPSWPYDRMNFTLVKYNLNEVEQEIYKLITQTIELGPWEPWVQQIVAELGLRNWNRLQDEFRELVKETVNNGIRHSDNTKWMLNLLARHNMPALACDKHYENDQVKRFCEKYLKK